MTKRGAYIDFPFGDIPMCIKVVGKIFAQIYPKPDDYKLTLKCSREMGEIYRYEYAEVVVRGYHCPPVMQPYFNTIYVNKTVSDDKLKIMIDEAYDVVVGKLTKKQRDGII